jgi:alkanesulfonate monooxygenase SsuD/methylene tetrahydromethanopterin reductase-like flavin-dependent oxidoreductase (luciferase family)
MTHTDPTRPGFKPTGRLHFGVSLVGPAAELDFTELHTLAQTAERGVFSLLTLDQRYWLREDPGDASAVDPAGSNDVVALLAALAAVTTNIGVVAAAEPDYDDPAGLANSIASLDRLSGGRAAWHVLADGATHGGEAPEPEGIASADGRSGFIESARRQWDAWEKPAPTGRVETLGAFERDGQLYSVGLGALRPTGPRYRPVVIHAAETPGERAFAARHADVVLSPPASLVDALATRRDVVAHSLDCGRGANDVRILQTATFILATTESQAVAKADWLRAQLPEPAWDEQAFIGSYSGVAERLMDFVRSGAVDGFNLMPWLFPDELADMVNHLIPALQDRGIYPTGYTATTLRGNLGLTENRSSQGSGTTHALPVVEVGDLGDVRLDLDLRMELIVQKMQA